MSDAARKKAQAIQEQLRLAQEQPNTNPGVSSDAPPGMFLNPETGQYTSRELLSNAYVQNQPPSAVGATLAGAGRGATLGGIDEISGAINAAIPGKGTPGERYTFGREQVRAYEEAASETNPDDMLTSEIAGAVSLPITAPLQAFGLLGKMIGSAGAGAGMGAGYGFLTGEGEEDREDKAVTGGKVGAAAGALTTLVGAGANKLTDALLGRRAISQAAKGAEETAAIRAQSGREYSAFEGSGAEITPQAMSRLRAALEGRLQGSGLSNLPGAASRTPKGQDILNTIATMDDQVRAAASAGQNPAVPLQTIEDLRRLAGDVAQDVNPIGRATRDARMGAVAVDEIDNFINGLQAADVPIGDLGAARAALEKARSLWATASKTQLLDNVLEGQDNYLGGSASAIRNKVATLLRNPKTARQFSEVEKQFLRKIIGGNAVSRAIRLAGNGIGRQVQMAGGAATGGVPGMLAGALTGELSSEVANRSAVRQAELARALMANGGIKELPVMDPNIRRVIESLTRRALATTPQQ